MSGHQEQISQVKKPCLVLHVKYVWLKQSIQLLEKVWIVQVMLVDKKEKTVECKKASNATGVVGIGKKIHQQLWVCHMQQHISVKIEQDFLVNL